MSIEQTKNAIKAVPVEDVERNEVLCQMYVEDIGVQRMMFPFSFSDLQALVADHDRLRETELRSVSRRYDELRKHHNLCCTCLDIY